MARLAECRDVRKLPVRNEDDATLGTREHDLKTIAGTLDKIIRKNKVSKSETVQNGELAGIENFDWHGPDNR